MLLRDRREEMGEDKKEELTRWEERGGEKGTIPMGCDIGCDNQCHVE